VHIPRQTLRRLLFDGLREKGGGDAVHWGRQLVSIEPAPAPASAPASSYSSSSPKGEKEEGEGEGEALFLRFADGGSLLAAAAIGADGIHSSVRRGVLGPSPLNYLGLMVILGIAPLPPPSSASSAFVVPGPDGESRALLRNETQAQWLDGSTRVFSMPFGDGENLLWQLSFPYSEQHGLEATAGGGAALKLLAQQRLRGWPDALVSLVDSTGNDCVSGHPVYDRHPDEPLSKEGGGLISLMGDAAHPMSPFKGQGANQALLDAVSLAQALAATNWARPGPGRRKLSEALRAFEAEMSARSRSKVLKSREAATLLHSPAALVQANITRSAAAAALPLSNSRGEEAEEEGK